MMNSMFGHLDLSSTSYTTPNSTGNGVIPWNISYSGWGLDEAANNPSVTPPLFSLPLTNTLHSSGSIYASTKDLSAFGRSILNNALLTPTKTRRWMKPLTFTSSMTLAVGAPWEIYRVQSSNRVTDYYTKGGDIGVYSGLLALIPDYNVGFSIFTADGAAADVAAVLSNMVANNFGPALEEAAKMQAVGKYAGSYTASDGSNSSVTIGMSDTFGLAVESWISEGNDMFADIELTQGITSSTLQFLARLMPVNLRSVDAEAKITSLPFRAVLGFAGPAPSNVFSLNCATWTTVDALNYGGLPIDLFVFQANGSGQVTGLSLPALRVTLGRVE